MNVACAAIFYAPYSFGIIQAYKPVKKVESSQATFKKISESRTVIEETKNNIKKTITCIGAFNQSQRLIITYSTAICSASCSITQARHGDLLDIKTSFLLNGQDVESSKMSYTLFENRFNGKTSITW